MVPARDPAIGPQPTALPVWLASTLVQLGSFLLVLGMGVLVVSLAYGLQSMALGLALLATGYLAVGFPGWYVVRLPRHRFAFLRIVTRLREMKP